MPDYRKQTGSRGPTRGSFTKPGFFYPSPDDPINDYGLIERKTVDSKEQPVAYLTAHPDNANLLLCKQEYLDNEDGKKTRTRIYRTLPGKKTTRYIFDDDLDVYVAISTQDVAIGSSHPTDSLILQAEDSVNKDMGWTTRQIVSLTELPKPKMDVKTEQFTFPALLEDIAATTVNVGKGKIETGLESFIYATGINTLTSILPLIRPALTAPSPMRVVTEFHDSKTATATGEASTDVVTFAAQITPATNLCITFSVIAGGAGLAANTPYYLRDVSGQTAKLAASPGGAAIDFTSNISSSTAYTTPTKDALYEIFPNNPRFSGQLINFNFGEVLHDAIDITAEAGTNDHSLFGLTESVSIGATSPTYTEYNADIGKEKLIASDIARYRGNIWTKQNTYITLR
jgi:hypothetical protein